MVEENKEVTMKLIKKIILKGEIEILTGLHIGASREGITIGGMDNPVLRDPITGEPYIPGSSLKGKIRSLLEITTGKWNKDNNGPCQCGDCDVCMLFGVPVEVSQLKKKNIGRVIFRDARMNEESKKTLEKSDNLVLPYTESKYEVAIERVTSKANPRSLERVPAGTKFDFEIVLNVYENDNYSTYLNILKEGIALLNDDYLGGSGTRGSGKVVMIIKSSTEKNEEVYQGKEKPKETSWEN